jgi:hypothetical protein
MVDVSTSVAFARGGGMGSHHSSVTGGAYGTNPATPGTNSLGTALSSPGTGSPIKAPLLGTNPAMWVVPTGTPSGAEISAETVSFAERPSELNSALDELTDGYLRDTSNPDDLIS